MTACEQKMLVGTGLEECACEQRTRQRQGCALNFRRHVPGFLLGIGRAGQVMEGELYIRVVDRPLEKLSVRLEERGPYRFGLTDHATDGPLKGIAVDGTRDLHEQAELPLRTGAAAVLRKPNIKLCVCYRQ